MQLIHDEIVSFLCRGRGSGPDILGDQKREKKERRGNNN